MHVKIEHYRPLTHAADVLALWDAALGESYPITEPVFWSHTIGHMGCEPGDGLVASVDGRVVGFALVQVDRQSSGPPQRGGPAVAMVHPKYRRQGIGSALVKAATERTRAAGVREIMVGGASLWRFWPGIPTDLEGAEALFEKCGYALHPPCMDLVRDVSDFELPDRVKESLQREGVQIRPADAGNVARVLAFEKQHFAGWEPAFRLMAVADIDHLLAAWRGEEIVGTQQMLSPHSRFRGANVVWERLLGGNVGGVGAVGVAEAWRKRGLGLALVAVGAAILRERGVGNCIIDWTGLVDFYGKLGFRVWRRYRMATMSAAESQ